jgi:hypothetical protein
VSKSLMIQGDQQNHSGLFLGRALLGGEATLARVTPLS